MLSKAMRCRCKSGTSLPTGKYPVAQYLMHRAPLAYFGDPAISTKETGDKAYNLFSDIIVNEVLEMLK